MATNEPQPAPALAYERSGSQYATRRQFRVLLALVLLNLLITLQFAYFPSLTATVKNRWAQYQQKKEQAAAVKQALAVEQQVMRGSEPAGKVAWDENPETAAALLGGAGYKRVRVDGLQRSLLLANWPRGAAARAPAALEQVWAGLSRYKHPFPGIGGMRSVDADEYGLVFMHGLKTPSGEERLVCVYANGRLSLESFPPGRAPRPDQPFSGAASKSLRLVAIPCVPGRGEKPLAVVGGGRTELVIHGEGEDPEVKWTWTPSADGRPEQIRIQAPFTYRFYAGRPDPADPSRFTIDYDVNGTPGTIRGRLNSDETFELLPTTGKVVGGRWYPAAPSTQPAGQ